MKNYRQFQGLREKGKMVTDKFLQIRRAEYLDFLFPSDQRLSGQVAEQSQDMIAVKVADKDLVDPAEANMKFPELNLGSFSTVD